MATHRQGWWSSWKKWTLCTSPALLGLLQVKIYFVRELLVAELMILVAFVLMSVLGGLCFLLGAISERGGLFIKEGVQAAASAANTPDQRGHERSGVVPSFL